jgi:hypothetical protein
MATYSRAMYHSVRLGISHSRARRKKPLMTLLEWPRPR